MAKKLEALDNDVKKAIAEITPQMLNNLEQLEEAGEDYLLSKLPFSKKQLLNIGVIVLLLALLATSLAEKHGTDVKINGLKSELKAYQDKAKKLDEINTQLIHERDSLTVDDSQAHKDEDSLKTEVDSLK